MASHEQVQQLLGGSSTSTSTSSSSSEDTSSDDEQQEAVMSEPETLPAVPAKMRIKLSIRTPKAVPTPKEPPKPTPTPTKDNDAPSKDSTPSKDATPTSQDGSSEKDAGKDDDDEEEVVQATVVDSSDEGDATEAVVQVEATTTTRVPKASATSTRKRQGPQARSVRLPPMSSPGLLIPPTPGVYRGDADKNGFTTPSSVFDFCMNLAGYTEESRIHRGSSVKRGVGDMFDSDTAFALRFPPLVPQDLLPKKDASNDKDNADDKKDVTELLLRALAPPEPSMENDVADHGTENGVDKATTSRKRSRPPLQFSDMVPLSLTLPYPESYVQKRLRYAEKIQEREDAIVKSQEAAEKFEDARERYEARLSSTRKGGGEGDKPPSPPPVPEPVEIPPIPEPPSPPRLSELEGAQLDGLDESRHPIYLPKGRDTSHLDPSCFKIVDGRYFGLSTNSIADPNFIGPNAPGIMGINVSGGTGLATAYAGSIPTAASASSVNATYYGSVGGGSSSSKTGVSNPNKSNAPAAAVTKTVDTTEPVKDKGGGPKATSNSGDLKKLMEKGGAGADQMKDAIIRAAVYAARVGRHGLSFVAPNGEVYPDVSKAFAAHAGIRPCSRCKNNKQGAYHCRLRRKHKDLDYDGGNSPGLLAPLFNEPLEDLLVK